MPGFIFDMDGTLIDSVPIWHKAEERLLQKTGISFSKEQRNKLNTLTLEEAGRWFHETFGVLNNSTEVVRALTAYMLASYEKEVKACAGAIDFLRDVAAADAPRCVLSSSPLSFIRAGLHCTGLDEFFPDTSLIISAEEQHLPKRETSSFLKVCERLGTAPEDTWLFDDSWYALEAAKKVHLHCIGVHSADGCGTHEELGRYSERVVDDFTELTVSQFLEEAH